MMKIVLAGAMMIALAAPALAQQPTTHDKPPATAETAFKKHDANGDGALTLAEVKAADGKVTEADFGKYDADKNSALSKDEFAKWVEAKNTPPASAPGE